jgi:hypothetical protein
MHDVVDGWVLDKGDELEGAQERLPISASAVFVLASSFTNITELHDDAISRAAPTDPPIGPSPLLTLVIDNRPLTMASKKVTTTFSVRPTVPRAPLPLPASLRRNALHLC